MLLVHTEGEPCTTVSLPHRPESVTRARHAMVEELAAHGVRRDVLLDAEIVLGELAANAVEHGRPNAHGEFEISWCLVEGRLRLSVIDAGRAPDLRPGPLDTEALRGRGLRMVDTICDRWVADVDGGTRVTAELRL
jgi:anti-sigma regulatory factor (Ser/Thr protein kinase)